MDRGAWQAIVQGVTEFHEQRSLAATVHGVAESDTTEHRTTIAYPKNQLSGYQLKRLELTHI